MEFRMCLETLEDCLGTTCDKKRTLEAMVGDAVARMAEDCCRIQALEVGAHNPPQ
jgi:hypothetical protein